MASAAIEATAILMIGFALGSSAAPPVFECNPRRGAACPERRCCPAGSIPTGTVRSHSVAA